MRLPFLSLLACLALWPFDCAHGSQAPDTGAAPDAGAPPDAGVAVVPPGCQESLAGEWQHRDDDSYRFTAVDDGRRLLLKPWRVVEGSDAGLVPNDMRVELARGPGGFLGQMTMTESLEGGKRCPASFDARIVACTPNQMTLRIEQSYAIDQDCKRVPTGGSDVAEHVLVRRTAARPSAVVSAKADAG